MPILTCSSVLPTMNQLHLEAGGGDAQCRRRRAIAMSSRQYQIERQKRQQAPRRGVGNFVQVPINVKDSPATVTLENLSGVTLPLSALSATSSALSVKNTKTERRGQLIKGDLDDEYQQAMGILEDDDCVASNAHNDDDGTTAVEQQQQQHVVPPGTGRASMNLQEVAILKPARAGVDSEYEKIPSPQRRVLVIMDEDEVGGVKDMEDWDMLEDDDEAPPRVNAPTFAEVVIARGS